MLHADGVSSTKIGFVFMAMAVGNAIGASLCGKMTSPHYWTKLGFVDVEGDALTEATINMRCKHSCPVHH